MKKQEVYAFLEEKGVWFEVTEHEAVFNMEELGKVELPYPEADAKNLFVRDDKHNQYYLITVKGEKRVNLKEFRKEQGTRPLSFASDEELKEKLDLIPGAVTPMGLLQAEAGQVAFFLDEEFLEGKGLIGVHPNDNTATVWLKTEDLLRILSEHGSEAEVTEIGTGNGPN